MRKSENLKLPLLDPQDLVQRNNINALVEDLDEKLFKKTTAALYGLGADAVPDEVFGLLSRFQSGLGNEYVWAKQASGLVDVVVKSSTTSVIDLGADNVVDVYAVASVVDGNIVLSYKVSNIYPYHDAEGYYAYYNGNPYYLTAFVSSSPNSIKFSANLLTVGQEAVQGVVGYVNSPNPNAYPVDDGYTYTALGQLGNKVQIATGSYTGTGTYGSGNKNSLTFAFAPKFLVVAKDGRLTAYEKGSFYWISPSTGSVGITTSNADYTPYVSVSGNTVSWYDATSSYDQFNESGKTYYYVAFG